MKERKFEVGEGEFLHRAIPTPCPNCDGKMKRGRLRIPGRNDIHVFIELDVADSDDKRCQPLDAWVCSHCGYVELHTRPSDKYLEE